MRTKWTPDMCSEVNQALFGSKLNQTLSLVSNGLVMMNCDRPEAASIHVIRQSSTVPNRGHLLTSPPEQYPATALTTSRVAGEWHDTRSYPHKNITDQRQ